MIPPRASEAKRHFLTSLFLTHAVTGTIAAGGGVFLYFSS
jgi:hypothetical protein